MVQGAGLAGALPHRPTCRWQTADQARTNTRVRQQRLPAGGTVVGPSELHHAGAQEGSGRNISFALTTGQVRNQTGGVARGLGWVRLKPGDVLQPVIKS